MTAIDELTRRCVTLRKQASQYRDEANDYRTRAQDLDKQADYTEELLAEFVTICETFK